MALFAEGKLFREAGTGSGGGDKHNKGYFVDESALTTAYPTAEAGDYAIVESTDTVWIWDLDNSEWKDSDQKGQVTSVNGQTGDVTLSIPDAVQYSTMPTASASNEGWIVQYTGATDSTYTHGYIYENTESLGFVGPAADATEGEPGESMVFALDADAFAAYLQTKSIVPSGQTTFYLEENSDPDTGDNVYVLQDADGVAVEEFSSLSDMESATGITWGGQEDLTGDFPYSSENATGFVVGPAYAWNQIDVQPAPTYTAGTGIDITNGVVSLAGADDDIPLDDYPCMIVATKNSVTNEVFTEWTTGYVRHINGMDQDVELNPQTLPAVWSMDDPNYPYVYADKIVQYQYQDDATLGLTEGYFYKSVEDVTKPEDVEIDAVNAAELTDVTITNKPYLIRVCKHYFGYEDDILRFEYRGDSGRWWNLEDETSVGINLTNVGIIYTGTPQDGDTIEVAYTAQGWEWQQINVQPSSVPTDPTFNSITLSGTTSYHIAAASSYYLRIGTGATISNNDLFIHADSSGTKSIAFGLAGGEVGASSAKMGRVYTNKINNGADIAVPTTGGTMAVIGVNTTATLAVADWSSNTQTVTVSGVKADSVVFVSPAPASASNYASAGILCTAQAADSLTFTCTTTPTNAITVNVVCM